MTKLEESWKAKVLSFGGRITLIQSVLASFLVYTLAAAMVPKMLLRKIERLMANFLWGVHGTRRTHLVSWEDYCRSVGEGGLGLHRLEQTMETLHAKLMWNTLSSDSLWAKFARKTYFMEGETRDIKHGSPLWSSMVRQYPLLSTVSRWIVGKGTRRFWVDNWVGEPIHASTGGCDDDYCGRHGDDFRFVAYYAVSAA